MTTDMKTDFNDYEDPSEDWAFQPGQKRLPSGRSGPQCLSLYTFCSMTLHPCPAGHCFGPKRKEPRASARIICKWKKSRKGILFRHKNRNEIFIYATTWVVPENFMLSKISQRRTNIIWDSTYMRNLEQAKSRQMVGKRWPEAESRERVVVQRVQCLCWRWLKDLGYR